MSDLTDEFRALLRSDLRHRRRPMSGNDPAETHRSATSLELLYDLVYVVAFGAAAQELAHALDGGAAGPAIGAYLFAIFGISWAWMNFTWFSSAYGNDDALFRIATIVQMVGAIVFTFGLPVSFAAAENGESANNALMVIGYVIMRAPLVLLWLRAARDDPGRRRTARAYAISIAIAQIGWVLTIIVPVEATIIAVFLVALAVAELIAPVLIERRWGVTPWNAGHIAERFSLLTLITLGEVVASTTIAVGALVEAQGWSTAAIVIATAGVVLTAGLWWAYFLIPSRLLLQRWPQRVWAWRYAHLPIFGAIAAVGAGLHVAAYSVEHDEGTALLIALSVGIPVAAVIAMVYLTWSILVRSFDRSHLPMLVVCLLPVAVAIVVGALAGHSEPLDIAALVWVIGLITLSIVVEVVVHELVGYRHTISALERR